MPRHRLGHIAAAVGKAGVFLGILTYSVMQGLTQTLPLSSLYSYLPAADDSIVALLLRLLQNTVTLCACFSASVCVRIVLAFCFGVTRLFVDVLATVWFFVATAKDSFLTGVLRSFQRYWNVEFVRAYLENFGLLRRSGTRRLEDDVESDDDSSGSEDEMNFGRVASETSGRRLFGGRTFLMLFFGVPMVTMWAFLFILPNILSGVRRRLRTMRVAENSRRLAPSHSERHVPRGAEELRFAIQNTKEGEAMRFCRRPGKGKRERCAICLDRKSCVRLMPCGHDRLCDRCTTKIMDPTYQYSGICPLCRTDVTEVVTI